MLKYYQKIHLPQNTKKQFLVKAAHSHFNQNIKTPFKGKKV
jgi:hypothetical protein